MGMGRGKLKNIFVVSKWCSGSRKCLLLNELDDYASNKNMWLICSDIKDIITVECDLKTDIKIQYFIQINVA